METLPFTSFRVRARVVGSGYRGLENGERTVSLPLLARQSPREVVSESIKYGGTEIVSSPGPRAAAMISLLPGILLVNDPRVHRADARNHATQFAQVEVGPLRSDYHRIVDIVSCFEETNRRLLQP